MNIHKDIFTYNKNDLKKVTNEEIIKKFNSVWDKGIKLVMTLTKRNDKAATLKLLNNKKYEECIETYVNIWRLFRVFFEKKTFS